MEAITRDHADDVMLASEQKEGLERQKQTWSKGLAPFGLRLNVKETEYLTTNQVDGNDLRRSDYSKYLGPTLSVDGNLAHEVT
ncbi:hypothetical protein Y032_0038g3582 [Ancylostoma ceylanicum]|uniref:Reverse transcriptase domain-containing protein n=1 Tax=Ancylostoma ceylanicum TaxID=53326 RepID=A0A016UJF4_9BILA|nr:hypothetical protein Y032_0038g3582 [Ancylostoma ceylanicum]